MPVVSRKGAQALSVLNCFLEAISPEMGIIRQNQLTVFWFFKS